MGDQVNGYTLDEALSAVKFGTFQGFALFFAGIGWFCDAMEISLLSFIGPAVKSEWSLSANEESLLTTSVFGGMLAGAYLWGFISDTYGRRKGILGIAIVMFGAGILSAFSPNYKFLVVLRCFLGFGAAGGHVFSSWFLEFVSISDRGACVLALSGFWILGELLEASLAWFNANHIKFVSLPSVELNPITILFLFLHIIMPRLSWRWLLALSSVPSLTVLLLCTLAPESPRYLFTKGRTDEAIRVLQEMALINRKELPRGDLVSDERMLLNEETPLLCPKEKQIYRSKTCLKSLSELLSPDLLRTTVLLWLLNFCHTFSYYGIALMISVLSSEQSECAPVTILPKNVEKNSLYTDVFFTYSAEFPALILAAVLVDRVGRKRLMLIMTALTVILILPLLSQQNATVTTALLVSARMFLSAAYSTLGLYAKEVYPTSVRATGFGLATCMGRIGGVLCPVVAVGLVRECHHTLAIIMFGIVLFMSGTCTMFLPFETKGRGLTDITSKK